MKKYFFPALIFLHSFAVSAQTACPLGVAAGNAQCGPSPAAHLSSPSNIERERSPVRLVPTGEWKKTWGAVAIDHELGDVGAVVGERTQSQAEKVALSRCALHGAKSCKIQIAYMNQCVVTFFPGVPGGKGRSVSAATIAEASEFGAKKCFEENGSACNEIYSACSAPIFDKF